MVSVQHAEWIRAIAAGERISQAAHRELLANGVHPNQCRRKYTGNRAFCKCLRAYSLGSDFCAYHTRMHSKGRGKGVAPARSGKGSKYVTDFYSQRLGPKLREFVRAQLARPSKDQLQLREELACMRIVAGDAIEIYSRATELPEAHPKRNELLAQAGALMQTSLGGVADMCERAQRLENISADKVSLQNLLEVVDQITGLARVAFGEHQDAADLFDKLMNENLQLPKAHTDRFIGTQLTPDQIVQQMDERVMGLQ